MVPSVYDVLLVIWYFLSSNSWFANHLPLLFQQIVMSFVSKVCDFLPDPADQLCTHFMNTYGPKALSELASLINPNKICTTLHLCKPSSFLHVLLSNKFYGSEFVKPLNVSFLHDLLSDEVFLNGLKTSLNTSVVGSNQTCQWCKTVLGEVKSFLSDQTTQVSNVSILLTLCIARPFF